MQNARLDESQAGNKMARKNINRVRYADDTTLMAERRGTIELLDEGETGEWKNWIKTQHSKPKILACSPIVSVYSVPSLHGKQKNKK